MNKQEKAVRLFSKKFNCAQAVFSVFASQDGLTKEAALKIASPFGAGISGMQETCGAVTGAIMAIGLMSGMSIEGDLTSKEKSYKLATTFIKEFKEKHASIKCLDLIGADMSTEEGRQKIVQGDLYRNLCAKFIRNAVEIVENVL